jgi:hypothetical protein
MTIKALFPTVRPTLNLDFANTRVLDPRITFTRASTATFVGSNGLIQTAASNVPRFDHNPTTGESLGLLVEEARTNLLLRSEEFDNASWTKVALTTTPNTTTAPNGTIAADSVIPNTVTTLFYTQQNVTTTASTVYTWSVYAKANGFSWIFLDAFDDSNHRTWFNIADGVVGTVEAGNTSTVTSVGNGWYRCTLTRSSTGGSVAYAIAIVSGNNVVSGTGNSSNGVYVWGAQLEAGSFPTSYIPTTTATATRAADVASITGTNFSSWYNQTEGTWFAQHDVRNMILSANNNTFSERQPQMGLGAGFVHDFYSLTGGAIQANSIGGAHVVGTPDRVVYALKANDFIGALNGTLFGADTSGSFGSLITQLNIGSLHTGASASNGTFKRLTYWPVRLPNTTLQAITAS